MPFSKLLWQWPEKQYPSQNLTPTEAQSTKHQEICSHPKVALFHTQFKSFWDPIWTWALGQFKWEKLWFQGMQFFYKPTVRPFSVRNQSTLNRQYGFRLQYSSLWHSLVNKLLTILQSRSRARPLGNKGKQIAFKGHTLQDRRTDFHKYSRKE